MKGRFVAGFLSLAILLSGDARAAGHGPHGGGGGDSSGIYQDVPPGHWAYEAVQRAAEAGVLQGIDGRFHGEKTINRYQMALIVSRILEQVGRGGDANQNLTEHDLQNLEALTIEFADELALLNVKVSTLEDNFAELRYDVEALKTGGDYGGGGPAPFSRPSAGIHGLASLRLVLTGAGGAEDSVGTLGAAPAFFFFPLTRYIGNPGIDATGAPAFNAKTFFTIPQLSLSWTRDVDEGIGAHLQVDFDADIAENLNTTAAGAAGTTSDLPAGDGNVQINEAYIDVNDFFFGIGSRMGAFALPVSREHNGSHRSLDYTITPSAINWRLETFRPVGVEFRNEDDFILWDWRLAVFSGLDGPAGNINAMLSPSLTRATLLPPATALALATFGGLGNGVPFTDVPQGVQTQVFGPETNSFGFFARLGDQPYQGFGWDVNYLANGGNVSADPGEVGTASEFSAVMGSLTYYCKFFDLIFQAYQGTTTNTVAVGPVPNAAADAVASQGLMGLFNYRFNPDNSVTLRVESNTDDVESVGTVTVTAVTAAYNRIISDHSLFQLEVIAPTGAVEAVAGNTNGAVTNETDQDDIQVSGNYKLRF